MIVLHGSWIIEPSRFYFWAERPAPGPKRKGKRPPLPPHPFAAPAEELTPALRALFGETFRPEALATVEAWLPSADEQPLPSPELLHLNPDLAPDEDAAALARFGVPAWAVVPLDALDALLALPDPASAARAGATLGADVRFWSAAAKLTVAMLAGQRYLPGMAPVSDTRYRAVWQAVTDEPPEASQISALVAAMPPVCRALRVETGRKAGRAPMPATGGMGAAAAEAGPETLPGPRTLLGSFMGTVIDRAVRAWSGKPRRPINAAIPSSAGEAWLGALYAEDPTFGGTKSALTELYDAWRTWLEGLHAAGGLGFRICFRLETPEMAVAAKQSAWGLRYFLQATDDLSLLVPATEVWQSAGASLSYFNRRFEQPQERMLAGLGLAGRLCPPVEASLRQRQPEAAQLTTDEAYHFLREVAPLLETSGFGVLVPPWWGKRGAASFTSRLKLKPKRKAAGAAGAAPGKLTFDTLVAFDWELAMGGQPISREEFERLAAMKTPLVQVRGEWVVMDPDAIERGIRFWEDRRNHGDATLLEALRMALDAQNAAGLPVEGVEATDWVQELLSELAAGEKMPELPAPPGFTGQLRPYQGRGVSWMWFLRRFGLGACLADDMGLGKCLAPDSLVAVNGALRTVEALWESSARQIQFDGEGFWAIPSERLVVHALDEVTGQIVMTPIRRLYRQHVQEQLRMVRLEDGSSVTITRRHQLLTSNGWTNDLQVGDYVCVPAQMPWVGQAEDPDLVKFLAWQIAEGHEDRKQASLAVSQKDTAVLEELLQTLHRIGQPVYVNGTQQFSRASLEQVLAGFNRVLSGEAERDYRQLKPSKWTSRTLDAYARLDMSRLEQTRQHLQRLLDQEVFYCRIKAIEEIAYDGWVYDLEVDNHHNFVANGILCHNTIQTTAWLLHVREQGEATGPALVICPTSVMGNWQREVRRFAPELRTMIHHGADRLTDEAFQAAASQNDIVISSYGLVRRDAETLGKVPWSAVIADEAQNIKNPETKQAQAVRKLPADTRVALTGTPVENRLNDLWSIMQFLNPGYLGSQAAFRQAFVLPVERYGDTDASARLKKLVQPFVLRRLKTDPTIIQDLPEKNEMKVYCPLTAEQATLYEAVVKDSLQQMESLDEGIERRGIVLAMLMKLKQVCNHPAHFLKDGSSLEGRSGKLERLTAMLDEVVSVGDRALVFTQFFEMGELLRQYLADNLGGGVQFLHGGTPQKHRERMIAAFQEDADGPQIFLLSLKAGGTGLNLTRANHVFHFDRWWNPAVENQATDRAFRIGQRRDVQVHKFVCSGTLEERIDDLIESKKALAENVLGAGEQWLTEMSTDQLRDLLVLRRDAVAEG